MMHHNVDSHAHANAREQVMRFSSGVMRAVGGIAEHPQRAQRDKQTKTSWAKYAKLNVQLYAMKKQNRRLTESSSQHQ